MTRFIALLILLHVACVDSETPEEISVVPKPSVTTVSPEMLSQIPQTLVVTVAPHPEIAVVGLVDVQLPKGAAWAQVLHGSNTYEYATPWLPVKSNTTTRIPVLELEPDSMNHFCVVVWGQDGFIARSPDVTVKTQPLPDGLREPPILKNIQGDGDGYILFPRVEFGGVSSMSAWAIVVSRKGRLAWYRPIGTVTDKGADLQIAPNGHFLMYRYETEAIEEVDR